MVRDTVGFLRAEGRRVFLDAEHFFDGFLADRAYALEVLRTAGEAGAEVVALCDTNGGMLPPQIGDVVADALDATGVRLGIHCHNDTGCAVANTLAAVAAGASHVQGTINGYGERTGNADLLTVVSNLQLKQGRQVLPDGRLEEATRIAHAVSEVTNVPPYSRQPYVGASAFAHKAGLHASAIRIDPDLYQHTDPMRVGNDMRMLVSDMAGRASIELKARELGYDLAGQDDLLSQVVTRVKELELRGYTFDAADASFALLLRGEVPGRPAQLLRGRVLAGHHRLLRRRRGAVRGHRQARRGRPAGRRDRGGQRPGQRARPRAAAGPDDRLPRDRQARADRLPGPHPRRRPRHRRGHPGAHRDLRRHDVLGDGRGRSQHRRGQLAGARRRHHLRPAAPGRVRPLNPARAVVPIRPDTCRSRPGCSRMEG